MRRSRSVVFFESGSQICGSLVIGNSAVCGMGPTHLTDPEMVPPSVTLMTLYSWQTAAVAAKTKVRSNFTMTGRILLPLDVAPRQHGRSGAGGGGDRNHI